MDPSQIAELASGEARDEIPADPEPQTHNHVPIDDTAGSSEEEDFFGREGQDAEDTASIIGISISKTQATLKSVKTPASEKMAAMDARGGFFDQHFDLVCSPDEEQQQHEASTPESDNQLDAHVAPINNVQREASTTNDNVIDKQQPTKSPPPALPSPWRTGPKTFERSGETSGILGSAFRNRSSSGSEKRTRIGIQLPSLPKSPRLFGSYHDDDGHGKFHAPWKTGSSQDLFQFDGPAWGRESWNQLVARARGRTIANEKPTDHSWSSTPADSTPHLRSPAGGQPIPETETRPTRPPLGLRRATSDNSLYLARTLSKASSLGDDSRFEHVHEQINSRLKAIRDSWQDSNLRRNLPNLPKPPSVFGSSKTDISERSEGSRGSGPGSWVKRSLIPPLSSSTLDLPSSSEHASAQKGGVLPPKGPRVAGMSAANAAAHPQFTEALETLTGDIVVLGGYRGSILREAQAPNRRLWVPLKVGFNLRKVDLEVGFEDEDEERVTEKIIPDGMLTHMGPVDISKRLFKRLRASNNAQDGLLRVHDYGYDWRLSPHRLSQQLIDFLEQLQCNAPGTTAKERGATVIAHSLGGLITRHAVNQRPDLFKGVVFAGVPESCVNVLGPLRNGDDVLFSSKVLTAQVNLSIRTSIVFLPLNGRCFIDKNTKEEYPVDFYSVEDWIKYRWSPCTDPALPPLNGSGRSNSIRGSVSSMIPESFTNAMPSIPFINRRDSTSNRRNSINSKDAREAAVSHMKTQHADAHAEAIPNTGMAVQMGATNASGSGGRKQEIANPATGVTISREKAIEYLSRVLPRMKRFREELAHNPAHQSQNLYPPLAVMYGKAVPTVCAARVRGRDGIARLDSYDDLMFASGDGVVLARAAQLPDGYRAAKGGVVASERGHVTILGDLEAVGRCLIALQKARRKGVGSGLKLESPVNNK